LNDCRNIIVRLIFKIQLAEIIVFTKARVVKTTEATTSVASNVATAMIYSTVWPQYTNVTDRQTDRTGQCSDSIW